MGAFLAVMHQQGFRAPSHSPCLTSSLLLSGTFNTGQEHEGTAEPRCCSRSLQPLVLLLLHRRYRQSPSVAVVAEPKLHDRTDTYRRQGTWRGSEREKAGGASLN